jgi:hypothetical protein
MRQNKCSAAHHSEGNQTPEIRSRIRVSMESGQCTEETSTMEPESEKRARIDALNEEINAIYFADRQYWQQGKDAPHDARIEHQQRDA